MAGMIKPGADKFSARGLELIRQATQENISQNRHGIEIRGLTANGEKIGVHIREEFDGHGNKRLYLISTIRGGREEQ